MSVKCATCDKSCPFRKEPFHSDYAALLARHNALVEAVAWERECIRQLDYVGRFWDDDNVPGRELIMILDAARTDVKELLK